MGDPPAGKRRRVVESQESQQNPLPRDSIYEILLRCSVDNLQRICSLCPSVLTILRDPYFRARYASRQENLGEDSILFVSEASGYGWNLLSTTVHQPDTTSVLPSSPNLTRQLEYANGILCSGSGHVTTLFNPTVGASRTLPPFPADDHATVKTFIGFDISSGQFKILGLSKRASSDLWGNQHIYTLEDARTASWRPLVCGTSHTIFPKSFDSKSISMTGLLYHTALLPDKKCTLIHLDLSSECFGSNTVPELPVFGQYFLSSGLLDVKGKVGVCFLQRVGTYRLWILEDLEKNVWSPMLIETPQSIQDQLSHFSSLSFEGFTRAGELVFAEVERKSFYLHCHNPATMVTRKELIQESTSCACTLRRTSFWNHKKTFMLT